MKKLLLLAAVGEAATGLILLVYPTIVVRLLFGAEITGSGIVMSRVTGIALIGLGIACLPGMALPGMLTYSAGATLYLSSLGIGGERVGVLLWPAVVVHAILTILLVRAWLKEQRTKGKTRVALQGNKWQLNKKV